MSCNDVICIIGMHRSGTSMIARALNIYGLNLGKEDELLGPSDSNLLGHFEHTGFLRINQTLLEHFGGSWDNPPKLQQGWEKDCSLSALTAEAKRLVGTFNETSLWGWKEPRSTVFLPFWKSIVPGLRFVICIRSPLDVARSLQKRNGISIGAGASLWNQYCRAAVRDTVGSPRIVMFYEDCFRDPVLEINRVAQFCGLSPRETISEVRALVADDLRHYASETAELLDTQMIPAQCKLLYFCMRAIYSRAYPPACSSSCGIDMTSESVDKLLDLVTEIEHQEEAAQLQSVLASKEQELHALRSDMTRQRDEQSKQVWDLEKQLAELQKQNMRLQDFSDVVRSTFAYRFYRKCLKPIGINKR